MARCYFFRATCSRKETKWCDENGKAYLIENGVYFVQFEGRRDDDRGEGHRAAVRTYLHPIATFFFSFPSHAHIHGGGRSLLEQLIDRSNHSFKTCVRSFLNKRTRVCTVCCLQLFLLHSLQNLPTKNS